MNRHLLRKYNIFLLIFFSFLFIFLGSLLKTPIAAEPVSANISGNIYTNVDGTQTLESTVDVSLAINGAYIDTVTTTESFIFSNISVDEGDVLTIYLDNNVEKAVIITKASSGADNTSIVNNLYVNHLTLNSTGADPILHADLDIANNMVDSDVDNFYESGYGLTVWNNYSAIITGNTNVSTDMITIEGDFVILSGGVATAEDISFYGDLFNYGTISSLSLYLYEDSNQNILSTGTFEDLSNVVIQKQEGTVYLQSDIDFSLATVSIYENATLDLNDYHLDITAIEITSGSLIMNDDGSLNLDNGQGSIYLTSNAYFEGNANNLELSMLYIYAGSTFVSSSDSLYVEELIVEDGTFTHNNGTVVMKGSFNNIQTNTYSVIDLNNLTVIDLEEDSNTLDLMVSETSILRISGALTLLGNGEDLLNVFGNGSEPFFIEMIGALSSVNISNVMVYNSVIDSFDDSTVTIPINPANSVNDGETSGWFTTSRSINGTVLLEDGSDVLGEGHEVMIAINGSQVATATTDSIGEFIVEDLFFQEGDTILLYLNGNQGSYGTTVLKPGDNQEVTVVDIYQNYLTLDGRDDHLLNKDDLLVGHTGQGTVSYSQSELSSNNFLHVNHNLYITHGSSVDLDLSVEILGELGIDGIVNFHEGDITIQGDLFIYGTLEVEGKIIFTGGGNLMIGTGLWIPIPTNVEINDSTHVSVVNEIVIEGTLNVADGSTLDCGIENKIETTSDATFTNAFYNCSGTGELEVNGDLLLNNSTFTLVDGYLSVDNLQLTNSSSLTAGSEIYIEEDFNLSSDSTFIPNGGTVNLEGYTNNLTGDIPFYNLVKLVQFNDFDSSIAFSSGSTYPISGNLTLVGFDENDLLTITSSAEGQFTIEMLGLADFGQLEYLEIRNSIIYGLDSELEFPINPLNSENLGNTLGWFDPDNLTEEIIFNSPSSSTIHNAYIPIHIVIPEPMLPNTLRLSFVSDTHSIVFTIEDIEDNTPKIFNLNIDNVLEGGNIVSIYGFPGADIPDGVYSIIASYQDVFGNPTSLNIKSNVTINRNYVEPEENEEDDDDDNQEVGNSNQGGNNNEEDNSNTNIITTSALQSNILVSDQTPVSSPVANIEKTESNTNEILELTNIGQNEDSQTNQSEYSFPWWIIILIALILGGIYLRNKNEKMNK